MADKDENSGNNFINFNKISNLFRKMSSYSDDRKAIVVQNKNAEVPADEPENANLEEIITIDPETEELYLNHKRITKIEHFEPLVKIER